MSCRLRAGLRLGPPLHEAGGPGIERLEGRREILPCPLAVGVQALGLENPPVTHQRHDHVVMVDAQVVDARLGDLHRLAGEAGDDAARHR